MTNPLADKVFSVTEVVEILNDSLSNLVLTIEGEIAGFKQHASSGHCYFELKDENSIINCAMWNHYYKKLNYTLETGMKVILTGTFDIYKKNGRLSLHVKHAEIVGDGQLKAIVEKLEKSLRAEGLFDVIHKKEIPLIPSKIALVTSSSGDAKHDVLATIEKRFPVLELFFVPTAVEGQDAPIEICRALDVADNCGADCVLLVRGGGSYSTLYPFNDERLVRKIFAMKTPVITGVGHEPDVTLVDWVADLRAATPTAAAQAACPNKDNLYKTIELNTQNILRQMYQSTERYNSEFLRLSSTCRLFEPSVRVKNLLDSHLSQSLALRRAISSAMRDACLIKNSLQDKLLPAVCKNINAFEYDLAKMSAKTDALSPLKVLSRGYAYAQNESGAVIKNCSDLSIEQNLSLTFHDGHVNVKVTEFEKEE